MSHRNNNEEQNQNQERPLRAGVARESVSLVNIPLTTTNNSINLVTTCAVDTVSPCSRPDASHNVDTQPATDLHQNRPNLPNQMRSLLSRSHMDLPQVHSRGSSSRAMEENHSGRSLQINYINTNFQSYRTVPENVQIENTNTITITPPPFPPRVLIGSPPISGAPPSYSAVMRSEPAMGRPNIRMQPSPPFIAPPPPPTYAEVQGFQRPFIVASVTGDRMFWGPDPISVICPRCSIVIITTTYSRRSLLTHFTAILLCMCGCWPCCLLPYCLDSCKTTYHFCPVCQQFLGVYTPL